MYLNEKVKLGKLQNRMEKISLMTLCEKIELKGSGHNCDRKGNGGAGCRCKNSRHFPVSLQHSARSCSVSLSKLLTDIDVSIIGLV